MNADGTDQTNLTNDPTSEDYFAALVAGRHAIAYTRSCRRDGEIFVMNTDGSDKTNLTNDPAERLVPDWSPDGAKIAFTSIGPGGTSEIYAMNADGSNQTNLTNDSGATTRPDLVAGRRQDCVHAIVGRLRRPTTTSSP